MHVKKKTRKRFSSVIILIVAIAVVAYFTFALISIQIDISQKTKEYQTLVNEVEKQEALNLELSRIVESDDEAAYMERIARERLGYAKPGELFFVDMSGE